MKNILAENLLRFGVKNLNESDKEKIAEALLTEQGDKPTLVDFGFRSGVQVGVTSTPVIKLFKKAVLPGSKNISVDVYSITMGTVVLNDIIAGKINASKPVNRTYYFVNGAFPSRAMDFRPGAVSKYKVGEVFSSLEQVLNDDDSLRISFGGNGAVATAMKAAKVTANNYGSMLPNSMDWKENFKTLASAAVSKVILK
jgi:hypothetical protein